MIRLVVAIWAAATVAGCAAERAGPSTSAASGLTARASLASADETCLDTFPASRVLGWMSVNVGELRAYHFGGPVAHYPLRSAFPGVAATQPAAWCVVREAAQSRSMWGVVPGHRPERAVTLTGPGEGIPLGRMQRPLQPP
jgi:hypothetical protein